MSMRLLTVALAVCIFAVSVFAESRFETMTLTLTKEQITKIEDGGGKEVTVNLTSTQIRAITAEFSNFKGKTMKVNTAQLRSNNMVKLTVDAVGEANPQPSP